MALSSMTGFARTDGATGPVSWAWEVKSVNSKGLDLKLRLPPGLDGVEAAARTLASSRLSRGSVFANLTVKREAATSRVRVNEEVLAQVLEAVQIISARIDARAPSIDGLLGVRGLVEMEEHEDTPEERAVLEAAILAGLERALDGLLVMRRQEGAALAAVLGQRLDEIAALTRQAEDNPSRKPEAIRARLAESLAALLEPGRGFDPDRLHQEALLMAAKADIREELDRLVTHVAAARKLVAEGGAVGRRLDFLAQEFNRETNTLCSKANDVSLTAIGLELKAVVEQFREQVQNLE
ncbi:YicC/YloC family endoribonuclease [Phreatobacter sp.]|uniref:YicC/YloC family endoribonuclease n=1 Tax=Phreatobacter sp. TaxID=1966341 RepID=UPI003F71EEE4